MSDVTQEELDEVRRVLAEVCEYIVGREGGVDFAYDWHKKSRELREKISDDH